MKKMVIKLGTGVLMSDGRLNSRVFNQIARQVFSLKNKAKVIIVSSGAIQFGREAMARKGFNINLEKKILSGIGSRHLINEWGRAFSRHGMEVAQILVTYANWESIEERKSIKSSISKCLEIGIIPIINENDIVAQDEISLMEKGISENDRLARMVALLVRVDGVLFLTEPDGVLDRKLQTIRRVGSEYQLELLGKSNFGSGGMQAKIKEAVICRQKGIKRVAIANLKKDTILRFAVGDSVGTEVTS